MSSEGANLAAGGNIPKLDGAIIAAGSECAPVRAYRDRSNGRRMSGVNDESSAAEAIDGS